MLGYATVDGVQPTYGAHPGPLAIAHRGGAGLAPENTLDAFARSYALGLRYLETDVRLTADGELVAFHDATLHRVTGVRRRVGEMTLAQVRELPVLGRSAIPTLGDVLTAFPRARFTVDLKERRAVEPLARVLASTGAARRVCLAGSWDSRLADVAERVGPELTVALGWRRLVATLARLRCGQPSVGDAPVRFAHVPMRLGRVAIFHDDLARRAHAIGVRVIVWTVDDPDTMHRLFDAGVDGIITDRPDLLREVLVARGQWYPPSDEPYSGAAVTVSDLSS